MKQFMYLFIFILLAGITFTGKTQDVQNTVPSNFKLALRILINETDPIALRTKGYLIEAFDEVPDISVVERDEDVVLQVSVSDVEAEITINGETETEQVYMGAATPHARIPTEYMDLIDKLIKRSDDLPLQNENVAEVLLTPGTVIPVWVGRRSLPFIVIPATEGGLESECADVVSNVEILLRDEWEGYWKVRLIRNSLKELSQTK